MEPIEVEEYKGYRIEIHQDPDPHDPREDDNIGTMACWHRRYQLGDEQPDCSPLAYKARLCDLEDDDQTAWATFDERFLSLPLYLYDHSGITISTSPFSCPWDSGQVGIIHVRRNTEDLTDDQLRNLMEAEVKEYDQYLRGEVYGYQIFVRTQSGCIESCWGFVGDSDYAMEEAKASIDGGWV